MKKKTKKQLDAEIVTSLAERARAKGFEPETEEGGRAMMQSLTMADIAKMKPRGNSLEPGTPVIMQLRQVGGTTQLAGIVTWDDARQRERQDPIVGRPDHAHEEGRVRPVVDLRLARVGALRRLFRGQHFGDLGLELRLGLLSAL